MKLRTILMFLAAAALFAAGCGSDDSDSKSGDKPKGKLTHAEQDVANKTKAVDDAKAAFEKKSKDPNLCRDLAMKYIALASPESTGDPKKAPKMPKDREKNLDNSIKTLKKCYKLAPKDRGVKQMLASTLLATSNYDDAADLLEEIANSSKGDERTNAYYAWGLAASNSGDIEGAIKAWTRFTELAAPKDPRVAQTKSSIVALKAAQKAPKPAAESDSDKKEG